MKKQSAQNDLERLTNLTLYLQRHFVISLTEQTSELKLSIPQYTLLGFLIANGPTTMGNLALMMGHSTPAATGLVDRLCRSGFLERSPGSNDRRQVVVSITENGRHLMDHTRGELIRCLSEIRSRLPPEDQKAWLRVYEAMHDYCEEKRSKTAEGLTRESTGSAKN
ncbi:MAG: MarR family winged helix-turn-helix transcriptional regulator [Candidatus Methylacidiphilales bacterium]